MELSAFTGLNAVLMVDGVCFYLNPLFWFLTNTYFLEHSTMFFEVTWPHLQSFGHTS